MRKTAPEKPPAREVLGVFRLGYYNVEIVLAWEERGGWFYSAPDDTGPPRIVVGMNYGADWHQRVAVLLHEATELEMSRHECRFVRCGGVASDAAAYVFHMDHQQFTEITARVAGLMADALPAISQAMRKRGQHFRRVRAD